MKKLISILGICLLPVILMNFLNVFQFSYKEYIFTAISVFFLVVGCVILKLQKPKAKTIRFLKVMPLRGRDLFIIFWFLIIILSGSFILNLLEVSVWDFFGKDLPVDGISGMSFENLFQTLFTMAVIPSIFEELFFRGAVLSSLEKKSKIYAIIISSLFFVLMHGSIYYVLSTFFVGVALSLLVYATHSVLAAMFVHFLNNVLSAVLAIYGERLAATGFGGFAIFGLFFIFLIGVLGALSAVTGKIKRETPENTRIYNEGEMVWRKKSKKAKKQVK